MSECQQPALNTNCLLPPACGRLHLQQGPLLPGHGDLHFEIPLGAVLKGPPQQAWEWPWPSFWCFASCGDHKLVQCPGLYSGPLEHTLSALGTLWFMKWNLGPHTVGHMLHLSSHILNPHVILKFLDGTKALKEATLSSRVGVPWDMVLCLLVALKKRFLNLGCGSATMNTLAL